MQVLEADLHRADFNAELFEAGEEVEEVVGREGELRRLAALRGQVEGAEGERRGERARCRGGCRGAFGDGRRPGQLDGADAVGGAMAGWLPAELQGIGEGLFVGPHKGSEMLERGVSGRLLEFSSIPTRRQMCYLTLTNKSPSSESMVLGFSSSGALCKRCVWYVWRSWKDRLRSGNGQIRTRPGSGECLGGSIGLGVSDEKRRKKPVQRERC